MRMKTSSTPNPQPSISRSKAWAYLITNAGVCPGLGSMLARRWSGLGELGLTLLGTVLTLIPMWHVLYTYATTLQPPEDTMVYVKQATVGAAIFVVGWLWSIWTGIQILRESKAASAAPK